jgi:enamine deaminase RidA (YjgF/YER057c/UK114 family)
MAQKITYPAAYKAKVQFSRSVVVGDLVFLSGCSGQTLETFHVSSPDLAEQTRVALNKIRLALEQAGTTMDHIIKTVLILKKDEDYDRAEATRQEYYRKYAPGLIEEPPADTLIRVVGLHEPDMLVEIEATAILPDKK